MSVQEQDIKENVAFHQYLFFPSITFCTFSYLLHLFVFFFFLSFAEDRSSISAMSTST